MRYLPARHLPRSIACRAEMHSPLAVAGAAAVPVPRADAASLLTAGSAPA